MKEAFWTKGLWLLTSMGMAVACHCQAGDDSEKVFKRVSASVVTVLGLDQDGRLFAQGSGVVTVPGKVVTNCHVVNESPTLKVQHGKDALAARWLLRDPSRDLCLLEVAGLTAPPVKTRNQDNLRVGETVYAVGNPLGFGLSVSDGLVAQKAVVGEEAVIVVTSPVSPGSSGGGVFDVDGRLLGISTSILVAGQNLNTVLPARWIGDLPRRGVEPPAIPAVPGPEPRWIEEADALLQNQNLAALEKHALDWLADQPGAAPALKYLGMALIQLGQKQEGERHLRESLALNDADEAAWRVLANTLYETGRRDEAKGALDRAAALGPASSRVFVSRGRWLVTEGRLEEAASALREAVRLEPGNGLIWRELGQVEDQLDHLEAAADAYRAALRLTASDPAVTSALARLLSRQGKMDQAQQTLGPDRLAGVKEAGTWLAMGDGDLKRKRYAAAESAFRKAVELAPDRPDAWALLGSVMLATRRFGEALEHFNRALSLPAGPSGFTSKVLTSRSMAQVALRNLPAALEDARQAVRLDPDSVASQRHLGVVALETRNFPEAAAAYRKVADKGEALPDDWASLGQVLEMLGQRTGALEALQQGEKQDPRHFRILLGLAGYYGRGGDYLRSLTYLERALEVNASYGAGWSSKGYALLKLNRVDEAIGALQTAVSLQPDLANSWINLGEAMLRKGNAGPAIQALRKSVELAPKALDARLLLTQAYLRTHQAKMAREQAQAMLEIYPDHPQGLGMLTLALLAEGTTKEAASTFLRLKDKNPGLAKAIRDKAIAENAGNAAVLK